MWRGTVAFGEHLIHGANFSLYSRDVISDWFSFFLLCVCVCEDWSYDICVREGVWEFRKRPEKED